MYEVNKFDLNNILMKVEMKEDNVLIFFEGFMDIYNSDSVGEVLENILKIKTIKYFIFDFLKLNYLSSAGFGIFFGFLKNIRNKVLYIINCSDKISGIFNSLGFNIFKNFVFINTLDEIKIMKDK